MPDYVAVFPAAAPAVGTLEDRIYGVMTEFHRQPMTPAVRAAMVARAKVRR